MTLRLVGLVFFLVSCAVAKAATPSGPGGLSVTNVLAPGDTLAYTVSWTAGARATNYDFVTSVAATNGTWTVIYGATSAGAPPASGTTTGLTFGLKLAAIPWDSATFTVSLTARNAAGSSSPVGVTWSVKRKPGPPGPPKVGSSATVTGLLVRPDTVRFTALGQTRQLCPFVQFADGHVALADGPLYAPLCTPSQFFSTAQLTVSVPQRLCADSGGTYCATGLSSLREWRASFTVLTARGDTVLGIATYTPDGQPPLQTLVLR
jgi:hypothetical protein